MRITYNIEEVVELDGALLEESIELITHTVNDGASIGFLAPLERAEARQYWAQVIEPGVRMWGALYEGKLIGSIQLHLVMKANGLHRAEVAKLMVHPSYRRHGIARQLLQAAEDAAKEAGRTLLVLDTREGDPSNELYLSAGYIEAGRIPSFAKSSDGNYHGTVLYYKLINRSGAPYLGQP
jgi:GNAT superfamily N-acetyltransferase